MRSDRSQRYPRLIVLMLATAIGVLLCFLLALLGFRGHGQTSDTIVQSLATVKQAALARTSNPRMLIISGSSGLYGIRAEMLQKRIGIPVINLGLHGGLGAKYLTYFGETAARRGDVVLWAIEYPLLTSSQLITDNAVYLSWARGDDYLNWLPWPERLQYLRRLSAPFLQMLVLNLLSPPPAPTRLGTVNDVGDMNAGTTDAEMTRRRLENVEGDRRAIQAAGTPLHVDLESPNVQVVLESIRTLKKRGVRVLATWPNVSAAPLYRDAFSEMRMQLPAVYTEAGAQFIEPADGGLLPEDALFDTSYHPNAAGAESRTNSLADAICAQTDLCRTFQHIGILSLEFHVDKLSRPLL